jgi:NAD(P)-dependent dehydrogenase (short-subunit alcohol dehydrogenase family)
MKENAMNLHLKNKTVLVTGSTKGIGLKTAETFLREGSSVWVNGRSQKSVDEAIKVLKAAVPENANVRGVVADVGNEAGIQAVIQAIPVVDVLVNNAGIFKPEVFSEISRESWIHFFEVNVLSGARLTQHYLPQMIKKNDGRVIFISSESAISIPIEMVHYGMTKTAQLAVARGAAETCKGSRVTVNSVLPGPTMSDGVETFVNELGMTEKEFFTNGRPSSIAQRFATTQEISDLVVFVASERASMINGAALRVDGGTAKVVF